MGDEATPKTNNTTSCYESKSVFPTRLTGQEQI